MAFAYICIFVAALLFSLQFIFTKLYQSRSDSTLTPSLWQVVVSGLWVLLIFFPVNGFALHTSTVSIWYALFYALSGVVCTLASFFAMSLGKVATVTLSMMIGGQAIPFVYGLLFTHARPTWLDYVGFALVLLSSLPAAIAAPAADGPVQPQQQKTHTTFLMLCGLVFFGNGFVSVFSDANAKAAAGVDDTDFLLLCALWTLLFGGLLLAVHLLRKKKKTGSGSVFAGVGHTAGAVLAAFGILGCYTLFNGVGNLFSLRAAGTPGMQSSVEFPLLNSAIMIFTAVWGWVIFHEKITRRELAGFALAVLGILLFMVSFVLYKS